ncbi:nucleotidyltransferase domain-containing protein [Cellulomonas sp. zg-ZUI199]|uniref:Nucleotidyltransferase domain-containing protein n=1 Tax=Cellulomonas wangleii TaxID=2816956 RepID=A0ABX8DAG8_9CELL|nr:nucleotidyltransferase domain-containing protein [Cellulomonas wangleii]MBO0926283.1 nucleotidyltransferase domain-containing protein [Cellulomonas wangleii]QVI62787.1 nucleotidyltransferase domain-containing protein [Cellulomonas wangleii]
MPTLDAESAIAEQFVASLFPAACGAVLAGSSASGTSTPTSDLDLVLICPTGALDGGRSSLAATYEHSGRVVEVFAYSPEAYRTWAGREVDAHRPVILTMLSEGVVLRSGPELHDLQTWARDVLSAGPRIEQHALDVRRYAVSALLDDLADADDPGERALLLADAFTALSELLLLTQRQWLGSGKWLLRRLRTGAPAVADRLIGAFASGERSLFLQVADDLLAPLGGRLQAGIVR